MEKPGILNMSKYIIIKTYSKGGICGMKRQICACDFCGKAIKDPISQFGGADYGLIPFNNSGEVYVDFDACDECLKKIISNIQRKKILGAKA